MQTIEPFNQKFISPGHLEIDSVRVCFMRQKGRKCSVIIHHEDVDFTFTDDVKAALKKLGFRNVQGDARDSITCDAENVITGNYIQIGAMLL